MKGLFRIVDMKRWYLCPQVRVADIVQLKEYPATITPVVAVIQDGVSVAC